jgi:quinolinate synthetase A
MKRNTLEKLYLCMRYELPEILMDEELRLKALEPIEKMLELSTTINKRVSGFVVTILLRNLHLATRISCPISQK